MASSVNPSLWQWMTKQTMIDTLKSDGFSSVSQCKSSLDAELTQQALCSGFQDHNI